MEQQKIQRWLAGLGKRTFVLCFEMFRDNYKTIPYTKIAELIPKYDIEAIDNNPINTLPRKATYAVDLFKKNAEIEALRICSVSKKLHPEVLKMAKNLLGKYENPNTTVIFNYNYQDEIEKINPKTVNIEKIKNTPPQKILMKQSEKYKRNPEIGYVVKVLSNFKCEIDNSHETFINKLSGKQYMEAHHIVPMMQQDNFEYSLDCVANIISVCPNCHRALHNAEYEFKKKIIMPLFEKKKDNLFKSNIKLTLEEVLKMYQ